MHTDLAFTMTFGAIAMAVVAFLLWWVGRSSSSETLSWEKKLGIWDKTTRESEERFRAGHQAARPFMTRYAYILATCALLTILLAFFSDIAATIVYLIGLVFLVLGILVVRKKANSA